MMNTFIFKGATRLGVVLKNGSDCVSCCQASTLKFFHTFPVASGKAAVASPGSLDLFNTFEQDSKCAEHETKMAYIWGVGEREKKDRPDYKVLIILSSLLK